MALIPSVKKLKHFRISASKITIRNQGFDENDVNRFLTARSEQDYTDLLQNYSSSTYPLFGFRDEDDDTDLTSLDDCRNMQTLMRAGVKLLTIARKPSSIYENLSLLTSLQGSSVTSLDASDYLSTVSIPLSLSPETERFLMKGFLNKPPSFVPVVLQRTDDDSIVLYLSPSLITISVQSRAMELLDILSEIMLEDVTMAVSNNQLTLINHSVASSLWLTLMELENHDTVIYCEECGSPCIAKPKRRNARRFCSDRCRQKHRRRLNRVS